MSIRWSFLLGFLLCGLIFVACGGGGQDQRPNIKILAPVQHDVIDLDAPLLIQSRAHDDHGLTRVELKINGLPVESYGVPPNQTSFLVEQSWTPQQAGVYFISVVAYDSREQASDAAQVTISVQDGVAPDAPQTSPTPLMSSPLPSATPDLPATGSCDYDATFVTDVTIPDDTRLAPGTEFVKTWRLRNTGTCDWGNGFEFVFVDGERMGGPSAVPVPPTPQGADVDISVPQRAPGQAGRYRGTWRMRTPDGQEFGQRPFVQIVVPPPDTPAPTLPPTTTPGPEPDLDIALISGNLNPLVGQPIAMRVTVHNRGPGATEGPAQIRAVFRAGLELEGSVPPLAAGAEGIALIDHTFTEPAQLEVFVSVDPEDEIREVDETNNVERVPLIVNPPVYATRILTVTPGLSFDLDDGSAQTKQLDVEWRIAGGTLYVGLLNRAGVAPLSGEAESISYALAAGLAWQTDQLLLVDLAQGMLLGFRTSAGRVGYARVERVLDPARLSARINYLVWDWPRAQN
jgi:hypothetical protein